MTQQFALPEPHLVAREPLYVRLGDVFVILSATVMSLAAGAWLIAQLRLDLSYAILASLGAYCALLLVHLLARRALNPGGETEAEADEDYGDVHWQTGAAAFDAALSRNAADEEPARSRTGAWPDPLPMPPEHESDAAQAFKFRPARMPHFESEPDEPAEEEAPAAEPLRPAERGLQGEINVEIIQDLIKKLADELNAPVDRRDTNVEAQPEAIAGPDAMIGRSVAALDTAARAMRSLPAEPRALDVPAKADVPAWWPAARDGKGSPPPPVDPQLARIAEAVAAERFEVLIEPIQALSEGRPRHYEVTMRLRTADGGQIEQHDYMRAAQTSELLAHIDAARMLRAARVARRLAERGRHGSVLSAMAGDSITDNAFLDVAAQQTANDGRVRLVLAFSQSDVRSFTPAHAEALGAMAASSFAFALEDVTDLEMDFGRLKALGFDYVKLDAQVFLDGMQAPGGCIPAADICRYLSEFGLALVVDGIEDDWLLAKVMGFGALLGKGMLFGGPRLIKSDATSAAA
jgi:cyclic-di-GMP phosphodiesterase TipF (flagellum assembly factor)